MTAPKKRAVRVPKEKVSFPQFLEMWNIMEGQETPTFHREIAEWLEQTDGRHTRLLMAFRDAAKSWLVCAWVAWKLHVNPNFTFMILSAIQDGATANAAYIRDVIERHPLTKGLVPVGDAELWRRNSFTVIRNSTTNHPTVRAYAIKSKWTGRHADYLLCDDVEGLHDAESPEEQARIKRLIKQFRSVAPKVLWVGTPHWGSNSLYGPLRSDPDYCDTRVYPAYNDNEDGTRTYTWPENPKSAPDMLELKLREHGWREFNSQYLLIPEDLNEAGLQMDMVTRYGSEIVTTQTHHTWGDVREVRAQIIEPVEGKEPVVHRIIDMLAAWDPAPGNKDDSVLAIVARSKDKTFIHRTIQLPKTDRNGWKPQHDMIMETLKRYGITKLYVETNRNDTIVAETRLAADRHQYSRLRVIGHHNTDNKELRIRNALESLISSGRLMVHDSVVEETPTNKFLGQALSFPHCMKGKSLNDFIDAAAFGIAFLRKHAPGFAGANENLFWGGRRDLKPMTAGSAGGRVQDRSRMDRYA